GDLVLNLDSHEVHCGDRVGVLTPTEFRILSILAMNEGMVVSFSRLIEYAWSRKMYSKANFDALKTHVAHLRRKLQLLGGQPGDVAQGLVPEVLLTAMREEQETKLVQRIVGARDRLDLRHGRAGVVVRAEGDPPRLHVSLRRHQGEGFVVGINHEHAGR